MAHPTEGKWRSSILRGANLVDDGTFFLDEIGENNAGEVIIKRGRHEFGASSENVTGKVTAVGNTFVIEMEHPDFGAMRSKRKYVGRVVLDLGPFLTVIVGAMTKRPNQLPKDVKEFATLDQEDGTVIITRP
jgi:hypothetical protein